MDNSNNKNKVRKNQRVQYEGAEATLESAVKLVLAWLGPQYSELYPIICVGNFIILIINNNSNK